MKKLKDVSDFLVRIYKVENFGLPLFSSPPNFYFRLELKYYPSSTDSFLYVSDLEF